MTRSIYSHAPLNSSPSFKAEESPSRTEESPVVAEVVHAPKHPQPEASTPKRVPSAPEESPVEAEVIDDEQEPCASNVVTGKTRTTRRRAQKAVLSPFNVVRKAAQGFVGQFFDVLPWVHRRRMQKLLQGTHKAKYEFICRKVYAQHTYSSGPREGLMGRSRCKDAIKALYGHVLYELPGKHSIKVPETINLEALNLSDNKTLSLDEFSQLGKKMCKEVASSQYMLKVLAAVALIQNWYSLAKKIPTVGEAIRARLQYQTAVDAIAQGRSGR